MTSLQYTTAAGSDVNAEVAVGNAIYDMKAKIGSNNRPGAITDYNNGNEVDDVKPLFDGTSDTGTVKAKFVAEYGSDFVDDFLIFVEAADVSDEAKNELIEKTLMDMVIMHLVLDKIDTSTTDADWDAAAAYYIGARTDSTTDVFTTYDRATKRAAATNFNTLESSGEASINAAIITALKSPGDTSRTKIRELYQALYAQNVLKYAYEIDAKLAEGSSAAGTASDVDALGDLVAEGLAFWRILKPFISDQDDEDSLDGIFSLDNVPSDDAPTVQGARHWNYCRAKKVVDAHMATLSTETANEVGTYVPVTTNGITCDATIPTGAESGDYTASGVTYTFTNDVGASLQFSEAIAEIKALLTSSAAPADIEAKYKSLGLKGLADLPRDGATYATFTGGSGHGSLTWIDDIMTKALASPNTWAPKFSARAEIIEKTLMDALAVQLILDDLEHAIDTDHTHTNDEKKLFIDHAAAKFLGTASKRTSSTVFARGNKRGQNYGTMADDGINAKANVAILTALKACKDSPSGCTAQVEIIKRQIKVIYAQATLRYAKLVGDDIADASSYEEHQAEGMAFFNVIFPWVKASINAADVEVIGNFFDVEAAPDSFNDFAYCKTKKAMETFLGSDASLLGTLDAAEEDGTVCAATLPSGASGVPNDVALYVPANGEDIGGSLSFSVAVMKTLDLMDEPSSFPDVLDMFRKTGLAGSGDTTRVGEPVWDSFVEYFGSATWMTDYIERAADNEATPTTYAAAREEMIEKTIRDAIATQAILSDLYRGSEGVTDAHDRYWNHGAAKYIGTSDDRSATVYNRANKRAANFGTFGADGETAVANEVVVAALNAGAAASSASVRAAQYEIVKKQIFVIYSQCVLRYANYLDGAFMDGGEYADHQAEGQAFWRVIAPFVKAVNANGATFLEGVFDLSRETSERTHYCRAKAILGDLGVTDAEIGTLEGIRYANCDGVEVPEDATEYLAATGAVSGASRSFAARSVAALGAFAAVAGVWAF